jgi:3-oxoacyl-[acyl-carrier-protein] synthase-1
MSQPLSKQQFQAVGIPLSIGLSALGQTAQHIQHSLTQTNNTLTLENGLVVDRLVWVGRYAHPLIDQVSECLDAFDSRNLRFALTALKRLKLSFEIMWLRLIQSV